MSRAAHRVRTGIALGLAAALVAVLPVGMAAAAGAAAERYRLPVTELEDYQPAPLPPGFGVQHTDVDGPVYVDPRGLTLYIWPFSSLRNGDAGEEKGKPSCNDTKITTSAGQLGLYPPGLLLPDLDTRPTCAQVWLPVYAGDDAQPVGKFSIVTRNDGRKQWAFDRYPIYTSVLDKKPGQVNGGAARPRHFDASLQRVPIAPLPDVPPAFSVKHHATGRLVVLQNGASIYSWDGDGPNKSNCKDQCLEEWTPVSAGAFALPQGEWSVIERSAGLKQWTFRGKPVYTHILDRRARSLEGRDVPGWHNVYTQKNVDPPAGFGAQDSRIGQVLADQRGRTIYIYSCGEDSVDQLACDHPTATQAYRLAICGNGDAAICNKTWPYLIAPANAKSNSLVWNTAWIDPRSGRFAAADAPGALRVWTYRDRPVYTFGGDAKPGDANGDAWGEYWGNRNGFKAFWLRDDFLSASGFGGNAD